MYSYPLNNGANPEAINNKGESILILAERAKKFEHLPILLTVRARLNIVLLAYFLITFSKLICPASQKINLEELQTVSSKEPHRKLVFDTKEKASFLLKNHSVFKEYECSFLIDNRYNDVQLQHEYDKHYGLTAKSSC